jgi:hypothetical protein
MRMGNAAIIDRHHGMLLRLLSYMLVYIGCADDTFQAMRFITGTADTYDTKCGIGGGTAILRTFRRLGDPWTISRRVHTMIRHILLPAEAATRRLIMVIAADLPNPVLRPWELRRKLRPKIANPIKLITLPRTHVPGVMVPVFAASVAPPPLPEPCFKPPVRLPRFALLDPPKRFGRKRYAPRTSFPRIISLAADRPTRVPVRLPATPYDRLPDNRLLRRVCALAAALDDLPKQARRFARWRAFRDAKLTRLIWPLRGGKPPGAAPIRLSKDRWDEHHSVLAETHSLAWFRLNYPDTS